MSHFDLFAQRIDAFGGDQLLCRHTSDDLLPVAALALCFESTAYGVDNPISEQAKEEMGIAALIRLMKERAQV